MIAPAGLIHTGRVAHVRHAPFRHAFAYRLWMLSLDLDRLDTLGMRLFAHNRAGAVMLRDADHGPRDGSPLRPWVEGCLARAGLADCGDAIRFMLIPRVLGYAFNPIAFFFCYRADGSLGAVLHQVKNTFGQQHAYLLPVAPGGGLLRQQAAKHMHVSPFFDMQGGYRFAFRAPDFEPGADFSLSLRYGTAGAPRMTATMRLTAQPMSDAGLLRLLLRMPLMPLTVMAAIHWQALRLWLRGARYHPPPPAPAADLTFVDDFPCEEYS